MKRRFSIQTCDCPLRDLTRCPQCQRFLPYGGYHSPFGHHHQCRSPACLKRNGRFAIALTQANADAMLDVGLAKASLSDSVLSDDHFLIHLLWNDGLTEVFLSDWFTTQSSLLVRNVMKRPDASGYNTDPRFIKLLDSLRQLTQAIAYAHYERRHGQHQPEAIHRPMLDFHQGSPPEPPLLTDTIPFRGGTRSGLQASEISSFDGVSPRELTRLSGLIMAHSAWFFAPQRGQA